MKKQTFLVHYNDVKKLQKQIEESKLTGEQAFRLIYAMMAYDETGTEPDFSDDARLDVFWLHIQEKLDEGREKYDETCARNRQNSRRSREKAPEPACSGSEQPAPTGTQSPPVDTSGSEVDRLGAKTAHSHCHSHSQNDFQTTSVSHSAGAQARNDGQTDENDEIQGDWRAEAAFFLDCIRVNVEERMSESDRLHYGKRFLDVCEKVSKSPEQVIEKVNVPVRKVLEAFNDLFRTPESIPIAFSTADSSKSKNPFSYLVSTLYNEAVHDRFRRAAKAPQTQREIAIRAKYEGRKIDTDTSDYTYDDY